MRKIPFAGIELTSQRVRGLRGTSELPGRPANTEPLHGILVREKSIRRNKRLQIRSLQLRKPLHDIYPGSPMAIAMGQQYNVGEKDTTLGQQHDVSVLLLPCLMMYYIVSVLFLLFVWCPCMAINVRSVCTV